MSSIYKDGRETINAATIYAAVLAAAAVAPESDESTRLMREYGYSGFLARVYFDDSTPEAESVLMDERALAYSEWLHCLAMPPSHITFKTGARSSHKIQNTRDRLEKFAAIVKTGAKLFGGGMVRTIKPRAAVSWPAVAVSLFKQLIEDQDYAAALDLEEAKLGAVFYASGLMVAPVPCSEIPGTVSGMRDNGTWAVYEPGSGLDVGSFSFTKPRARAAAVAASVDRIKDLAADTLAAAMVKAQSTPHDHEAARADWMAAHDLSDERSSAQRIKAEAQREAEHQAAREARRVEDKYRTQCDKEDADYQAARELREATDYSAQAAQDVAQVLASAQAAAAIDQASESAALHHVADVVDATTDSSEAEAARELATVDAEACEAVTRCELANAGGSTGTTGRGSSTAARPVAGVSSGQQINSKTGNWSARFYTAPDGRAMLAFSESGGSGGAWPFESGRERMAALQTMARNADQAAAAATPAKRAPRLFAEQSTEYTLRGITWRVTVARYWVIDAVAEDQEPDLLCWRASKQGGRFGGADFARVDAEKMPRDAVARAHAFFQTVEAQDRASSPSAGVCSTAPNAEAQNPGPASSGQFKTIWQGVSGPATNEAGQNVAGASSGQFKSENGADLTPAATPPAASAAGGLSITLTRAEGLSSECGQPVTVPSFAQADALLHDWSKSAPKSGGYDKCDFSISWPDGGTYNGRYDLKHHSIDPASLSAHMIDEAEYHTGKFCPLHLSAAAYTARMDETNAETRTAYGEILATMAGLGAYFPKVRPVAIDLRAMVAAGAAPAALVGLGVVYCGDRCNQGGRGAIMATGNSDYYGLVVDVVLEDGSEHRQTRAADFGDGIGARYRLDGKIHGAPYLAQLAGAVATVKASASAAKAQAESAHAKALIDFSSQYPQLKRADTSYAGGKLAAVNMRVLLKAEFGRVKFSVTSDYNSVRVSWTDGPNTAEVEEIIGRFDIGASDSQSDYFYTVKTAFSELFGGCQYLSTSRTNSPAQVAAALAVLYPDASTRPSFDDYTNGRGAFDFGDYGNERARRAMREQLESMGKAKPVTE